MQTIGIIGGMSWYSTINYYRIINAQVQEALGGHHSARVLIDSLDFDAVRACQLAEDWDAAGAMLAASGRRLQDAGADTVLIGTNLMHKVAPAVMPGVHDQGTPGIAHSSRRRYQRIESAWEIHSPIAVTPAKTRTPHPGTADCMAVENCRIEASPMTAQTTSSATMIITKRDVVYPNRKHTGA